MPRWKYVSRGARGQRVVAQERTDRDGVVYLSWSVAGVPGSRSLGYRVRNDRGGLDRSLVALAVGEAERVALELSRPPEARGVVLGETEAMLFHPATGKYPVAPGARLWAVRAREGYGITSPGHHHWRRETPYGRGSRPVSRARRAVCRRAAYNLQTK